MLPKFTYPLDPRTALVCGIDEAGRGPLMGDVVAGCVILDYNRPIAGLNDSKQLSEAKRDELAAQIKAQARAFGIGRASPQEIDELNILYATYLAMSRAFTAMTEMLVQKEGPEVLGVQADVASASAADILTPQLVDNKATVGSLCGRSSGGIALVLIDGNRIPPQLSQQGLSCEAVVKGDARVAEIAAASILAKTTRDADLYALDKLYPEYGFALHKGYPTPLHLERLQRLEILPCYRRSFGPVRKILEERGLVVSAAEGSAAAKEREQGAQGSLFEMPE